MASRKPKAGDAVLFLGKTLEIDYVRDTEAGRVAHCKEPELIARRDSAKAELAELRSRQLAADRATVAGDEEWRACADRVRAIDAELRSLSTMVGLRCDLLQWVESRDQWGATGRMLSSDQRARFAELFRNDPAPGEGEVKALELLGE